MEEELYIKRAGKLLGEEISETGIYGKLTTAHKKNEKKKEVAMHIIRNAEAIRKLIFEDRNAYLENDIHEKNQLLNNFVNSLQQKVDLETYKTLKASIHNFLSK